MLDEIVQNQPETQETQTVEQPQQESVNWRHVREQMAQLKQQNEYLAREVQSQRQPAQQPKIEEDDLGIGDDEIIEGKHLKKYIRELKNEVKRTKEELTQYNTRSVQQYAEERLKRTYTDIDSVVTQENLQRLAQAKPSLYRSIVANTDLYDRGEAAYDAIKTFVGTEKPKIQQTQPMADLGSQKPRSVANSSPQAPRESESPLASVGGFDRRVLTKERQDELLAIIEQARRGVKR